MAAEALVFPESSPELELVAEVLPWVAVYRFPAERCWWVLLADVCPASAYEAAISSSIPPTAILKGHGEAYGFDCLVFQCPLTLL